LHMFELAYARVMQHSNSLDLLMPLARYYWLFLKCGRGSADAEVNMRNKTADNWRTKMQINFFAEHYFAEFMRTKNRMFS